MHKPRLIGFSGFIGSGKTEATKHLIQRHGFIRVRFAGPLKDMMRALGLSDAEVDGELKETPSALLGGKTPRYAMQTLGTEWGRNLIHSDLWTDAAMEQVRGHMDMGVSVAVDDVRFPNEVESIRAAGGKVIRITRAGVGPKPGGHVSEPIDLPFDLEIFNDLSITDLREHLNELLEQGTI